MRWRRRHEPIVLLVVALLAPAAVVGVVAAERWRASAAAGEPPEDLPAAELLLSPTESRRLTPAWWLEQALAAPRAFHRAATFCRRRKEAPAPNCRNVLAADAACSLLHSLGGTP